MTVIHPRRTHIFSALSGILGRTLDIGKKSRSHQLFAIHCVFCARRRALSLQPPFYARCVLPVVHTHIIDPTHATPRGEGGCQRERERTAASLHPCNLFIYGHVRAAADAKKLYNAFPECVSVIAPIINCGRPSVLTQRHALFRLLAANKRSHDSQHLF